MAEYKVTPRELFGEPDSSYINPETGETAYQYTGTIPGLGKSIQSVGSLLEMIGIKPGGVQERTPDNPKNPTKQPAYDVSGLENPSNTNQSELARKDNTMVNIPGSPQAEFTSYSPADFNQYDTMLQNISSYYGKEPGDVEDLMNRISFHETGPDQRYKAGAIQRLAGGDEGVGRGLFQFEQRYKDEAGEYGQAGGLTARNRLAQYFEGKGQEIPDWLFQEGMNDLTEEGGFDASKLTDEQQKMLFLGNIRMGGGRTLEGMEDTADWWSKHHHIGGGRTDAFGASMDAYKTPEDWDMMNEVVNPSYQDAFPTQ